MPATADLPSQMPRAIRDEVATTPPEVLRELRLAAALFLFEHGRIGTGRAAELAGISRVEFFGVASASGIPIVNYDPAELEGELRALGIEPESRGG